MTSPLTAAEAAAQLAQQRTLVPTERDLQAYAAATAASGPAVGLAVVASAALYDDARPLLWVLTAAIVAVGIGVEVWQRLNTRVVSRKSRRYQRIGLGVTGGSVILTGFTHPPYVLLVVVATIPCLVAAWLIRTRGRG